ncbi:MAG: hypothetical protein V7K62_16230 [Nostoc sp.]
MNLPQPLVSTTSTALSTSLLNQLHSRELSGVETRQHWYFLR